MKFRCVKNPYTTMLSFKMNFFPLKVAMQHIQDPNIEITAQNQREDGNSSKVETTWGPLAKIVYCTKLLKESLCT